jgi:hypothetical protein
MTNSETARAVGGVLVSASAAITSYLDGIEQVARIGASIVAIGAGLVVIWSTILKHINRKDKKHEIPEEDTD